MSKKLLKILLSLLLLILSPMILGLMASAVFIAIQLAKGESFSAGMLALTSLVTNLLPALPYLTGIPAALVAAAFIFKNSKKIQSWFRKEEM